MVHNADREITPQDIRQYVRTNLPLLLEIGANDGTDTKKFINEFSEAMVYCFEPDPRPLVRFQKNVGEDSRVKLFRAAVSDQNGEAVFHQSCGKAGFLEDWDMSGSLKEPVDHLIMWPEIKFEHDITVQTIRLDDWAAAHIPEKVIDLVWVDVQGAEDLVFRGGRETFSEQVRFVYAEFFQREVYRGQPRISDLMDLLPGFELTGLYQANFLAKNTRLG